MINKSNLNIKLICKMVSDKTNLLNTMCALVENYKVECCLLKIAFSYAYMYISLSKHLLVGLCIEFALLSFKVIFIMLSTEDSFFELMHVCFFLHQNN